MGALGKGLHVPPCQREAPKGFCLPELEEGWEPDRAQGQGRLPAFQIVLGWRGGTH